MRRLLVIVICAALLVTGCARLRGPRVALPGESIAVAAGLPEKYDSAYQAPHDTLAKGDVAFGIDLYKTMRAKKGGNLIVSPFSVTSALALTANGAAGDTRKEMERVLRIDSLGRDSANEVYANVLAALRGRTHEGTLTVANALWADNGLSLKDDFLARDRDYFGAQLTRMPFDDKKAVADAVNAWVDGQTRGKIPQLLDELPDGLVMELVNAVYFKADWKDPFDAAKPRAFTFADGSQKDVPTMTRTGSMGYFETPEVQAVRLPYKDEREMIVFLPSKETGLAGFEKELTAEAWADWMKWLEPASGTLRLPKFTLKTKAELSEPLKAMGMPSAFDSKVADFTGMAETNGTPLFIGRVDHSVWVAVDEKGAEAAASTGVGMTLGAAVPIRPSKPFVMNVERPFFFVIRDTYTSEPLFMGAVEDPRGD